MRAHPDSGGRVPGGPVDVPGLQGLDGRTPRDQEAAFGAALRGGAVPGGVVARGDVERRMDVYRNNVAHGLATALAARFPVIRRLVGAEFFGALAKVYIAADPPRSPVLAEWGAGFAGFVARFPPLAAYPYMGAVARVEFARGRAFHAADAAPLDPARLAGADADTLRLGLHPAVTVLRMDHPGASIWARNQPGAAGIGQDGQNGAEPPRNHPGGAADTTRTNAPAPAASTATSTPGAAQPPARTIRPGPEIALILRDRNYAVPVTVIGAGDAALVDALRAGRPLGAAAMAARLTDPDHDPQPLLLRLMAAGAITDPKD